MYDDLLKEYLQVFGEGFPTFELADKEDTEIIELLETCLAEKKPIENYIDFDNDKIL